MLASAKSPVLSSGKAAVSRSSSGKSNKSEGSPRAFRSLLQRFEKAPKLEVPPTDSAQPTRRRRRRSLNLPEFSDSHDEGDGLLRTGSFSDKNSKKWSLPVPTSSYYSEASDSTTSSYTSRSSGVESLSPRSGQISPTDMTETGIPGTSGESERHVRKSKRQKKWSKAAITHKFAKIYSYVFERCRTCDTYIYLSGFKCEKCNLYTHSKCLKSMIIICGQRQLPRKLSPVFGVSLDSITEEVPYIVAKCCLEIEMRGCDIKGIYRVNGMITRVRKLVRSLEYGPYLIDVSDANPNDLANVLKEYFRSLPEPIFTRDLYSHFIEIAKVCRTSYNDDRDANKDKLVLDMKQVVDMLPPNHRSTLSFLMHHLKHVADNEEVNQMSAKNLGLVFAPTLFRMKDPEGNHYKMIFYNASQALIIELLITYCFDVFGPPPKVELFNFG